MSYVTSKNTFYSCWFISTTTLPGKKQEPATNKMKRREIKCISPSHPSRHRVSPHTLSGRKWRPLYLFIVRVLVPHQLRAAWKNYTSVSAYVDPEIRFKRCMECVIRLCGDHVSPPSRLVLGMLRACVYLRPVVLLRCRHIQHLCVW